MTYFSSGGDSITFRALIFLTRRDPAPFALVVTVPSRPHLFLSVERSKFGGK
jgi:hypothetical protein